MKSRDIFKQTGAARLKGKQKVQSHSEVAAPNFLNRGIVIVIAERQLDAYRVVTLSPAGRSSPKVSESSDERGHALQHSAGHFLPATPYPRTPIIQCRILWRLVARYSARNALLSPAPFAATSPSLLPSRRAEGADRADSPAHARAAEVTHDSAMTR